MIYTVHDYTDGKAIGEIEMTDSQFAVYENQTQQPEGLIPFGELAAIGGEYTATMYGAPCRIVEVE